MANDVILVLGSNRGGTHLFGDLFLTSPAVSQLMDLGVFWQLYHRNKTSYDEILPLSDPAIRSSPGYNFQFDGPHLQLDRALTYGELFQALCQKFGVSDTSSMSLEDANVIFARGLDAIKEPHGIIFNKLTFCAESGVAYHWTVDDCKASLDYLYQFFKKNPEYQLTQLALVRNPYDVFLAMQDKRRFDVTVEVSLRIIRSYGQVLSYAREADSNLRFFKYEDIVNDTAGFRNEVEQEFGISISPDLNVYNNAVNKPHGDIKELEEVLEGSIFEEFYTFESVVLPSRWRRIHRYTSLQRKILWYLITNKESSGGGSAMKSLDPVLRKMVKLFPPARARYMAYWNSERWQDG